MLLSHWNLWFILMMILGSLNLWKYARFMFLSHFVSSNLDGYKKSEALTLRLIVIIGELPNPSSQYILFGPAFDFWYAALFLGGTGNW